MNKALAAAILLLASLWSPLAAAHSILVSSQPAANATVSGPGLDIELKFDSRVDAARSRLFAQMASGKSVNVKPTQGPTRGTLMAHVEGLEPGACTLVYEVLSVDGHIARGSIPFTVRNR